MMKRLLSLALCAAMLFVLCGCAGVFEKEYVLVEDYAPAVQENETGVEKLTVHDFAALKQAMRSMVSSGQTSGTIIFDSAYEGDVAEDLSDACWQLRTQDALCAYCVVNIFYELNKIVAYSEAEINISYSSYGERVEDITVLPYSTGLDGIVRSAMAKGRDRVAVLIDHSSLSAEDMEDLAAEVYRKDPALSPQQPLVSVNMYSGAEQQRLYELNLRYGMTALELEAKKLGLSAVRPFEGTELDGLSEGRRALMAFEFLVSNVTVSPAGQNSSIYSALVERCADSEGVALAYVELCRQLGVECRVVYGQRNWQDHCWNIIRIGQDYYHVDAALDSELSREETFMRRDEHIWEICRWDMASYPSCTGSLSYVDVLNGYDTLSLEFLKPKPLPPEEESGETLQSLSEAYVEKPALEERVKAAAEESEAFLQPEDGSNSESDPAEAPLPSPE